MIKCPKCGSEWYDSLYIESRDLLLDNTLVELEKVQCEDCKHEYFIRNFYIYHHSEMKEE